MAIQRGSHSPIVLLIGSTGSGKSALGNFLLNPAREHIIGNKQTFRTSRSNKPETHCVYCVCDREANPTIQVIDTPGLNEGDCEDLAHMSDIVITLRRLQHVSACVLCVNFNANIDQQWKATAAYYSKLLRKLFESNIVIVMTHFQTDERSIRQREAQGIDVDEVTGDVVSAVKECGGLTYSPHVFRIDSVPLDEYDRPQSEKDRSAILSYIKSLNPVQVSDLRVAKTDALRQKDNEKIGRLHVEINCYSEHLKKVKVGAAPVVDEIESMVKSLSKEEQIIAPMKEELADKDVNDHVTAETWSLQEEWKWFRWPSQSFECESKWHIVDHTTWDDGHLKWKVLNVEDRRATGKVEGKYMHGLHASLTLHTEKRLKYAERIAELRESIETNERSITSMTQQLERLSRVDMGNAKEIDELMEHIAERRTQIQKLSQAYLSLEEVNRSLATLRT